MYHPDQLKRMKERRAHFPARFSAVFFAVMAMTMIPGPQGLLAESAPKKPETRQVKAPSGKVFKAYRQVAERLERNAYAEAMAVVKPLLESGELEPHEMALLHRLAAQIETGRDRIGQALVHLDAALKSGGLEAWETLEVRYNLGILYLNEERYDQAIGHLEYFLKNAQNPNALAYYVLGSAYGQKGDWAEAARYADVALEKTTEPRENFYSLAVAAYYELRNYSRLASILEPAVRFFPKNKPFWTQLSVAYQMLEREVESYGTQTAMYALGMLTQSGEIERLADLHRYHGVPYKAAILMDSAMQAGQAKKSEENWRRLGEAWFAAREFRKARQALIQAAGLSSEGEMDYRVATTFVEEEAWPQAKRYLKRAVKKGELGNNTAHAWLLLGHAHYNLGERRSAMKAFSRASEYKGFTADAQNWVAFIASQFETEQASAATDIIDASLKKVGEATTAALQAAKNAQYTLDTLSALLDASEDRKGTLLREALEALSETRQSIVDSQALRLAANTQVEKARSAMTPKQGSRYEPLVREGSARLESHLLLAGEKLEAALNLARELEIDIPSAMSDQEGEQG